MRGPPAAPEIIDDACQDRRVLPYASRNPMSPSTTDYRSRLQHAQQVSAQVPLELVEHLTREQAVEVVVEEYAAPPITLLPDTLHMRTVPPHADLVPSPTEYELAIDCQGAIGALHDAPSNPPHASVSSGNDSTLTLRVTLKDDAGDDPEALAKSLRELNDTWLRRLTDAVAEANAVLAEQRTLLYRTVDGILGHRHHLHTVMRGAAAAANVPLGRVQERERVSIPMVPKRLTLADVDRGAVPGNEAALAESIADDLIGLIRSFSDALERTPTTANRLVDEDEETIRDVLLFLLNANWNGLVTGESFLGSGKTDILLRWQGREAFIGECKIWKGQKKFDEGLTQLLDGYTVWRATRVAMILFIRDAADITAIIDKARAVIRAHARFVSDVGVAGRDAYLLRAQHDAQQIVTLDLVPVAIPRHSG